MTASRRIRMVDVAQAAGVSRTTASLVLNGREHRIPPETVERVRAAARQLGYRANRLAQNLVRKRSELIGVMVPNVEHPFFAHVLAHLNRRVNGLGYRILFEVTETGYHPEALARGLDQLVDWSVDGLLLWWDPVYAARLDARTEGIPTVYLGSSPGGDVDCAALDVYAGARAACLHLIALGHRRIAYIGTDLSIRERRETALRDAMAEAGLPEPIVRGCLSEMPDEAREVVCGLMAGPDRPTALFCFTDMLALGAMRGVRDAGLRLPEDVSVVGYDDIRAAQFMDPPLTTVALPLADMADRALDRLLARMAGDDSAPRTDWLEPRLVVRQSTAPP